MLRCLEDKGQDISPLHFGQSLAPKQWNKSVLSVAGLKAGLISIFQLVGDRLVSLLGLRETALSFLEDKGQSILYLHSG